MQNEKVKMEDRMEKIRVVLNLPFLISEDQ